MLGVYLGAFGPSLSMPLPMLRRSAPDDEPPRLVNPGCP